MATAQITHVRRSPFSPGGATAAASSGCRNPGERAHDYVLDIAPDMKPWGNPRFRLAGNRCMPAWPIPAGSLGKPKILTV